MGGCVGPGGVLGSIELRNVRVEKRITDIYRSHSLVFWKPLAKDYRQNMNLALCWQFT